MSDSFIAFPRGRPDGDAGGRARELLTSLPTICRRIAAKHVVHVWETACTSTSMTFAWCCFFASRRLLANIGIFQDQGACILSMILAALLSVACIVWVWLINKFLRVHATGAHLSRGLQLMVKAIGILIGFSWEQCFDEAVAAVGEATSQPRVVKVLLALGAVGIVAPAWRLYIAPMVALDGWRFGFISRHVVEKARALTARHGEARPEFIREYRKLLHELQTLHHGPDMPDIDATAKVFDEGLGRTRSPLTDCSLDTLAVGCSSNGRDLHVPWST